MRFELGPDEIDAIATAVVEKLRATEAKKGPRLLSVEAAAEYLGRSPHAIRHLVKAGKLPTASATRSGIPDGRIFLDRLDLDALIDRAKRIA